MYDSASKVDCTIYMNSYKNQFINESWINELSIKIAGFASKYKESEIALIKGLKYCYYFIYY